MIITTKSTTPTNTLITEQSKEISKIFIHLFNIINSISSGERLIKLLNDHSSQLVNDYIHLIDDLETPSTSKDYLKSTGLIWQSCKLFTDTESYNNKDLCVSSLASMKALIEDALEEFENHLNGNNEDFGWDEFDDDEDELNDKLNCLSVGEKEEIGLQCIELIKSCIFLLKKNIDILKPIKNVDDMVNVQVDNLASLAAQLSESVDDLTIAFQQDTIENITDLQQEVRKIIESIINVGKCMLKEHKIGNESDIKKYEMILSKIKS